MGLWQVTQHSMHITPDGEWVPQNRVVQDSAWDSRPVMWDCAQDSEWVGRATTNSTVQLPHMIQWASTNVKCLMRANGPRQYEWCGTVHRTVGQWHGTVYWAVGRRHKTVDEWCRTVHDTVAEYHGPPATVQFSSHSYWRQKSEPQYSVFQAACPWLYRNVEVSVVWMLCYAH